MWLVTEKFGATPFVENESGSLLKNHQSIGSLNKSW